MLQQREELDLVAHPLMDDALASADLNALRLALYQATGDEALAAMRVV